MKNSGSINSGKLLMTLMINPITSSPIDSKRGSGSTFLNSMSLMPNPVMRIFSLNGKANSLSEMSISKF